MLVYIDRVDCISVQTTSHPFYLFTQEFVRLLSHDICNLQSNFRHTAIKNYITMLSVLLTCYRTLYAFVSCSRNLLLCAQFSAILLHVHAPQIGTVKETRYLIVFSMSEVGDLSSFFFNCLTKMVRTTEHKSLTKSHQKSSVRLCSLSQNILQYRAISSNPTRRFSSPRTKLLAASDA